MEPFQPAHESDVAAPHVSKAVITTFSLWGAPAELIEGPDLIMKLGPKQDGWYLRGGATLRLQTRPAARPECLIVDHGAAREPQAQLPADPDRQWDLFLAARIVVSATFEPANKQTNGR